MTCQNTTLGSLIGGATLFAYATKCFVINRPEPDYRLAMTIAGLWDYIKRSGLARPLLENELEGKHVVVDASIW